MNNCFLRKSRTHKPSLEHKLPSNQQKEKKVIANKPMKPHSQASYYAAWELE